MSYGKAVPSADAPATVVHSTPPNPSGPTLLGVGFWVDEIREINPIQSDFRFRGIIRTVWCDPRLAFDSEHAGVSERVYAGDDADALFKKIWYPQAFPVNRAGELTIPERVLRVSHDGTVSQDLNLAMHLIARYDLRRFPFDRQTLELQIESFVFPSDQVRMTNDAARTGFSADLDVPEWTIENAAGSVVDVPVLRSDELFSRYVFAVDIARKPAFYVWKVFLPLLIIVSLSWSVFWMLDEKLAGRSRISATGVLTIVAYQFVFAGDLPRVGYLTLLDKIMIGSFAVLSVTVVESMIADYFRSRGSDMGIRIDRHSRWVFPLAYAIVLISIFSAG